MCLPLSSKLGTTLFTLHSSLAFTEYLSYERHRVRNFILRVHNFILRVHNFILRVHNFILREHQPPSILAPTPPSPTSPDSLADPHYTPWQPRHDTRTAAM